MVSLMSLFKPKNEQKAVPFLNYFSEPTAEVTRDGINKSYIPKFLYKPSFGYPRYANMAYIRYLAQTPYVEMCTDTIIKELCSVPWDIIPNPELDEALFKDKDNQFNDTTKLEIAHIKGWLENPNTNKETYNDVFVKMPIRDVLEVNSGIINKVFNLRKEMVEAVARDGATFTKNPDPHGMMTHREEILIPKEIIPYNQPIMNPWRHMSEPVVREQAAYFQFGWITGPIPVPFGKREIIWMENMKRSDDIYGFSPVQLLQKNLQMLLYHVEGDLEYFNDNNIPKGIIGIDASDSSEIKAFKEQWNEVQRTKDEFGNWKKLLHKVPILNHIPAWVRFEYTSQEMQLIEKQKWYSKMVWACFGVTSTELGYTEDSQGMANQIVQSKVFRKKSINPLLQTISNAINLEIIPEFDYYVPLVNIKGKVVMVPKYVHKYKLFDIDEEKSKADLYTVQIKAGIKTVNEIRAQEGDEPVEWGDQPPRNFMQADQEFSFGGGSMPWQKNPDKNATDTNKSVKEPKPQSPNKTADKVDKQLMNKKSDPIAAAAIESKPFAGYDNFQDCVNQNRDKRDPQAYCATIMRAVEGKAREVGGYESPEPGDLPERGKKILADVYASCRADGGGKEKCAKIAWDAVKDAGYKLSKKSANINTIPQQNPLIVQPEEEPVGPERLEEAITYILELNEKKLISMIENEMQNPEINNIQGKAFLDVINKIKEILSFQGLRGIAHAVIKNSFLKGNEEAEKHLDRTFMPDPAAIEFLQNYTFSNIQGMTDEIADKLRGELQRAFMEGEGIDKIRERVKKVFNVGRTRTEMIARTETNRAQNKGKLLAYYQSGVKGKKKYIAHIDHRTSSVCKRLNDQEVDLDQPFVDPEKEWTGMTPPAHPNCRSTWAFIPDLTQ